MSHFVLVYHRRLGDLEPVERFRTSAAAMTRRFQLERIHRDDPDTEVVVLSARSAEHLRRTHGRYFQHADEGRVATV